MVVKKKNKSINDYEINFSKLIYTKEALEAGKKSFVNELKININNDKNYYKLIIINNTDNSNIIKDYINFVLLNSISSNLD